MTSPPPGYTRHKAPKEKSAHPETEARRPPRGIPRLCKCCYTGNVANVDNICGRCLVKWNKLAEIEKEIAQMYPSTERLAIHQVFRKLWENYKKLRQQVQRSAKGPVKVGVR